MNKSMNENTTLGLIFRVNSETADITVHTEGAMPGLYKSIDF